MSNIKQVNPSDCAVLLVDHQSGLFQLVKDVGITELRTNLAALAKMATLYDMPVITTASVPEGPNGPLAPEVMANAPHATYVAREGEINAWDRPEFVEAVKKTGKKQLIIAGVLTSVCVAFPSLSATAEGFEVFAVMDASGDVSEMSSTATLHRLAQAGVAPISTVGLLSEIQGSWNKPNAGEFGQILSATIPHYIAAIESHARAFEEGKSSK